MKDTGWDYTWCVTQQFSLNGLDTRELGRFNTSWGFITANYGRRFSTR